MLVSNGGGEGGMPKGDEQPVSGKPLETEEIGAALCLAATAFLVFVNAISVVFI